MSSSSCTVGQVDPWAQVSQGKTAKEMENAVKKLELQILTSSAKLLLKFEEKLFVQAFNQQHPEKQEFEKLTRKAVHKALKKNSGFEPESITPELRPIWVRVVEARNTYLNASSELNKQNRVKRLRRF